MDVVRRAFCVWFLLHVWSGHSGVLGGVVAGINSTKKNYFSGDGWTLVDAGDNKPITKHGFIGYLVLRRVARRLAQLEEVTSGT
jgi:hypothetical protein